MTIQNRKGVRQSAYDALAANPGNPGLVVLLYIGILAVSGLVVSALLMVLDNRISQTGGLGDLGLRSILSTIRTVLPIAQTVILWGVQLGYQNSTLRMARRQSAEPRDLKAGFACFGPLVRSVLLRGGLYLLIGTAACYAATFLFMFTPMAADFYELVSPLVTDPDAFYTALSTDDTLFAQVGATMWPVIPMFAVLFLAFAGPFFYQYRMVPYCILDDPRKGALRAMADSARMMKGSRISLLKLDLGFWWFWLGQAVVALVLYGDVLLAAAGVVLPWSATVSYYVFYVLSLALEGVLYYFFLNRVETTYATAYEILRPRPQPSKGAVLGNIFDLARDYHE